MKTSDFFYELPKELIAQTPAKERSDSRLLIYNRANKSITDGSFNDILAHIRPEDVLVRNTTKVIPARLQGLREQTGGKMEFLLLRNTQGTLWECLCRPAKRAKIGHVYVVSPRLAMEILDEAPMDGGKIVKLLYEGILEEILDQVGEMPLPPYITERSADMSRYQTVYAKQWGSAAAPTAGLHFTKELLSRIEQQGTAVADVLLHVGLGTFRPVSETEVEKHVMHEEYYQVTEQTATIINERRKNGGRILCVGTTSVRTLESVSDEQGTVHAGAGFTKIFITPGYRFKAVDGLITNFHLPESTLLMLVSALSTREEMQGVYAHAVEERYRFFSFGDACFIE